MATTIELVNSPFEAPIGEACGVIFKIHAPYNDDMVTLLINPNIDEYLDEIKGMGISVAQFTSTTGKTEEITLDFKGNNLVTIDNEGAKIEVKLLSIGSKKLEEQNFPVFEILVTEK